MELKPCPFCGSTDIDYGICTGTLRGFGYVQCEDCGAEISTPTKCNHADTAIQAWNMRTVVFEVSPKAANKFMSASMAIPPMMEVTVNGEIKVPEIESLKRQLQEAAIFAASQPHCPDGKDCDGYSTSEQSCTACWLEYWRQKAGEAGK